MSVFASAQQLPEEQLQPDPDWWRGAVIYQIYPRSFQDSNGDGIGDLAGIRQRLPYIANLGADAIWISPFFPSPMKDFGYDVSDYRGVDPMFGSLEDFRVLVDDAHHHGLKVMIDLVISHTSDQHPWFAESRSNRENHKADWYVWADPKADGSPPNNWLSIFGGSAWEWDTNRRQYYMHNFLTSQPDLNFHNPEVQNELLDIVRFWLELGVDGFRLDTINFYFHSQSLKDNPALPPEARNASIAPEVNPYNYQDHLYDKSQPENVDFLKRFRAVLDEFPAASSVGEVGDAQRGMEILAQYTAGDDRIHMCYSFDFLSQEPLTPDRVRRVIEAFGDKEAGAAHAGEILRTVELDLAVVLERRQRRLGVADHRYRIPGDLARGPQRARLAAHLGRFSLDMARFQLGRKGRDSLASGAGQAEHLALAGASHSGDQ